MKGGAILMEENEKEKEQEEVDGMCPECGHAFKVFVDRLLADHSSEQHIEEACPVCGCGECKIGR
jgi:hypothetical protein